MGDRTLLQQVIVNFTVNAMQAMTQADSTHRQVTIRTTLSSPTAIAKIQG
jgi:C4-dicarboxylate-specific signal transduction histidine kinase